MVTMGRVKAAWYGIWGLFILSHFVHAQEIKFITREKPELPLPKYTWQQENTIRKRLPLNGPWTFKIEGKKQWGGVMIPCGYQYQGVVTFQKRFTPDSTFSGMHFKLVCYGINYQCTVLINNKFLGSHYGGYSSFVMDVEDGIIRVGQENIIEIRVDDRLDARNTIPLKHQSRSWENLGGIGRDIFLVATPEIYVEDLTVTYDFNPDYQKCQLTAHLVLRNLEDSQEGRLRCYMALWEAGKSKPISRSQIVDIELGEMVTQKADLTLRIAKPKLWSPDTPYLYELRVFLLKNKKVVDEYFQYVGIKDVQSFRGQIYLNGQRLVLKGVNWYEDYPGMGHILSFRIMEEEISRIKELGANAVRVVGHPPHPYLMELCDRLGLLVLQEIPIHHVPAGRFLKEDYLKRAQEYLREMIVRDRNHPSMLAWGLGSNLDLSQLGTKKYLETLHKQAKQLDHRFTYLSFRAMNPDICTHIVDMPALDVFGADITYIQKTMKRWLSKYPHKPLVISAYGYPFLVGTQESVDSTSMEEHQAYHLEEAILEIQKEPQIDGSFVTGFADWLGSSPMIRFGLQDNPAIYPVGLMTYTRNKRISYQIVQAWFTRDKKRPISSSVFPTEYPPIFPLTGLGLIIFFLFFYKRRRYFRENIKRTFIHPHGFYTDLRDNRKVPGSQTFLLGMLLAGSSALMLSSFAFYFKRNLIFDESLTLLFLNSPFWKQKLIWLVWKPTFSLPIFAGIIFLLFLLLGIGVKLLDLFLRRKLPLSQTVTFAFWVGANYLVYVPLGMIFYRLLQKETLLLPSIILIALINLWFLVRLFRGLKVIYTLPFGHALMLYLIGMILIVGGIGFYYHKTQAIFEYANYYKHVFLNNLR